jgi:DNA repair protein RecO (recombination protein O)
MTLYGTAPQVFDCVKCKKNSLSQEGTEQGSKDRYYFSAVSGGILCETCKWQDKGAISINTSTLYTMQYIITREIEKLYTFKVTEEVRKELQCCIKHYLECYIDRDFKSLEMLKSFEI